MSTSTPTDDLNNLHSQCCTENADEGCGLNFPGKPSPGLCQKCILLNTLDPTSQRYQQAVGYLQCLTCGVAWQRFPYTDQCGPCNQKALTASGLVNHSVNTALQARSQAFNLRTHCPLKQNALAVNPVTPTIALNTAALDQIILLRNLDSKGNPSFWGNLCKNLLNNPSDDSRKIRINPVEVSRILKISPHFSAVSTRTCSISD
ncbi:hypothetical protein B0H14DRAFT_2627138 [Mycena olivaceomarginata]|nr:hypothetical protein B0H14DRAFT_2627138 [Mycena olivaceomarginata]